MNIVFRNITKFRIPGIDFFLKDNGGTPTQGHVLTVDGSGEASFEAPTGGATGGGSDKIFYENGQTVTTSYTITSGNNAISAGPISIQSGAVLTVPSNSTFTIV